MGLKREVGFFSQTIGGRLPELRRYIGQSQSKFTAIYLQKALKSFQKLIKNNFKHYENFSFLSGYRFDQTADELSQFQTSHPRNFASLQAFAQYVMAQNINYLDINSLVDALKIFKQTQDILFLPEHEASWTVTQLIAVRNDLEVMRLQSVPHKADLTLKSLSKAFLLSKDPQAQKELSDQILAHAVKNKIVSPLVEVIALLDFIMELETTREVQQGSREKVVYKGQIIKADGLEHYLIKINDTFILDLDKLSVYSTYSVSHHNQFFGRIVPGIQSYVAKNPEAKCAMKINEVYARTSQIRSAL